MKKRLKTRKKWLKIIVTILVVWLLGNAAINNDFPFSSLPFNFETVGDSHIIPASEEWNLIVVNRWNKMPEDYSVTLTELSNGEKVDSRIYPYLQEMFDAMRNEGIYPIVREEYRTAEYQQETFDEKVQAYMNEGYSRERAERTAKEWVAMPGTSEHQIGIAVDINADKTKSTNEEVYTWLAENAHNYGFILRYPQGKTDITGTSYEPWHFRYVGIEHAQIIYEEHICLEEYLENI